jgi:hypothetical protein
MDADDARKMIALLEEIRDGQQLQLRRQAEALERQTEALGMQRQHYENLQIQSGKARELQERAEKIQAGSARLIGGARVLVLTVAPLAALLLVFVCWMVFSRLAR